MIEIIGDCSSHRVLFCGKGYCCHFGDYVLFYPPKINNSVEKAYLCIRNVNANNVIYMSIEDAIMGGIVFKGKKDKPQEEEKVKTKAKKATYIRGQHGSGAAKMKADIRKKRANRHKK